MNEIKLKWLMLPQLRAFIVGFCGLLLLSLLLRVFFSRIQLLHYSVMVHCTIAVMSYFLEV